MDEPFNTLYNLLVTNGEKDIKFQLLDDVLECARLNKVLLQFFRTTKIKGKLAEKEENKMANIIKNVEELAATLDDVNCVFYKLIKPVAYVPGDIDILISRRDLKKAIYRLRHLGFKTKLVDPYCLTVIRSTIIVDLYIHPALGGMIYLDGEKLLQHITNTQYYTIQIPTLEKFAEALVTAAHALIKEGIYTFNDYLTIKKWANDKTQALAESLKCRPVLEFATKLNEAVEKGVITLPYKLSVTKHVKILLQKIIQDSLTKTTSSNLLKTLTTGHGLEQLKLKLMRKTY